MTLLLTINDLLALTAEQGNPVSYRTLRYYSSLGLIASAAMQKDSGGHTRGFYPASTTDRIAIINLLQAHGLKLQQIGNALEFILRDQDTEDETAALGKWRQTLLKDGYMPLLYDLLPVVGENLRNQLVDMLLSAGISTTISALKDVRLTLTSRSGRTVSRRFFIAPELLEVSQLNFWDLPELAELLAKMPATLAAPHSLIQVRAWLHGRTDWEPQNFWLARYEQQAVGCSGLHQPWPLQLRAEALLFGPVV